MATITDRGVSVARLTALAKELDTPGGGFSVNPLTGDSVSSGFAVGIYEGRERQIGGRVYPQDITEFALDNADVLAGGNCVLGGWRDADTGVAYLDVSVVLTSRADAVRAARDHDQIAIFDLDSLDEIRVVPRPVPSMPAPPPRGVGLDVRAAPEQPNDGSVP